MRPWMGVSIMFLFLLSVTAATAFLPDDITIFSTPEWAIAGGDPVIITISVNNSTLGGPVRGVEVTIDVLDTDMGTITSKTKKTDHFGQVHFSFMPKTRSGDARIAVSAYYNETYQRAVPDPYRQKIDHATPRKWLLFSYSSTAPISATTNISVKLGDTYNNIVDNHNKAEEIKFFTSIDSDGGFQDGGTSTKSLTLPVSGDGTVTAQYLMRSSSGDNVIQVLAPSGVNGNLQWIVIRGIAITPNAITSTITPTTGKVRANNIDTISLMYRVVDSLGNPLPRIGIWRNTTLGEADRFITDEEGLVATKYGPKASTGTVGITAMVEGYPAITVTDLIEFIPTEPVMWELSANPQTLASRDVKNEITAQVRAKVMDTLGNPIQGVPISFEILSVTNSTVFADGGDPYLSSTSAVTDTAGFATVQFHPGAFPLYGQPGYAPAANGTATIRATWDPGRTRDVILSFVNYPYLRIETGVDRGTVGINTSVNATVRIIGDGWAFQSRPINVLLAIDRSGSMGGAMGGSTRIEVEKEAAKVFVGEMDPSSDRIGIVEYNTTARLALPLSSDHTQVKNTIDALYANGWTATRMALYQSINEMIANRTVNPCTNSIQAVVLMSDGEFNRAGDPMARGSGSGYYDWGTSQYDYYNGITVSNPEWQNMARYAQDNNIRIYTIAFSSDIKDGTLTWNTMVDIANTTGGFFRNPTTAQELEQAYLDIAEDLKLDTAATDTTLSLSFQQMSVTYNNTTSILPGEQVVAYRYVDGQSSRISSWSSTPSGSIQTIESPSTLDQTSEWMNSRTLTFPIGNISINQTWEAQIQFQAITPGNVNIFGQGSQLTFKGDEVLSCLIGEGKSMYYNLAPPDTYITVTDMLVPEAASQASIDVKDLNVTEFVDIPDFLIIQWTTNYTGNISVEQEVYYQFSQDNVVWTGDWIFVEKKITTGQIADGTFNGKINVLGRPGFYLFRVLAKEAMPGGAFDEEQMVQPVQVGQLKTFIVIK